MSQEETSPRKNAGSESRAAACSKNPGLTTATLPVSSFEAANKIYAKIAELSIGVMWSSFRFSRCSFSRPQRSAIWFFTKEISGAVSHVVISWTSEKCVIKV